MYVLFTYIFLGDLKLQICALIGWNSKFTFYLIELTWPNLLSDNCPKKSTVFWNGGSNQTGRNHREIILCSVQWQQCICAEIAALTTTASHSRKFCGYSSTQDVPNDSAEPLTKKMQLLNNHWPCVRRMASCRRIMTILKQQLLNNHWRSVTYTMPQFPQQLPPPTVLSCPVPFKFSNKFPNGNTSTIFACPNTTTASTLYSYGDETSVYSLLDSSYQDLLIFK